MHIEIGILSQDKIAYASVAATALLGAHALPLLKSPTPGCARCWPPSSSAC